MVTSTLGSNCGRRTPGSVTSLPLTNCTAPATSSKRRLRGSRERVTTGSSGSLPGSPTTLALSSARRQKAGVPGHPEVELALVELYRATGTSRYLELAKFFIDERGYESPGSRALRPSLSSGRRALPPGTRGSGPLCPSRLPGLWGA